jgi:arylformamidase
MARWIDLSGPLFNGMWSYNVLAGADPHLPEFEAEKTTTVGKIGWESFGFVMSSLSGTYLETAAHLTEGGPVLDDFGLDRCIRPAVVCHLPRKRAREIVRRAELEAHCPPVQPGDALLFECGWGAQWRSPNFVVDGPSFHPDTLPWLLEQPFSLLGGDVPCLQASYPLPDGARYEGNILLPMFRKGILLLAPLINLDTIHSPRGELIALPLKVEGVSGAPCRAIFRED